MRGLFVQCLILSSLMGCGDQEVQETVSEKPTQDISNQSSSKSVKIEAQKTASSKGRYSFVCSKENLSGSDKGLLRFYRNEIFARLGRSFKSADLQQLFGQNSWYKVSASYSDDLLTDEDKRCLEVIQALEKTKQSNYPLYPPGVVLSPDLDGDGQGEKVSYNGLELSVGSSKYTINESLPMYFQEESVDGAIALIDLDMKDSFRELLVVNDPGVTDELQFQLFGYRDKKIVPLMDKAQWVQMGDFKHLVGALQHTHDNCGTAQTLEWSLKNGSVVQSKKTKKTDSACAACPYVYTLTERMQRFSGEILKNQNSEDLYREDVLELGRFTQKEKLKVRLVELKPETTFLDSISIVVSDDSNEVTEQLPKACSQERYNQCVTDKNFTIIEQGSSLDLSFEVPVEGTVWLKATGYYLPHE